MVRQYSEEELPVMQMPDVTTPEKVNTDDEQDLPLIVKLYQIAGAAQVKANTISTLEDNHPSGLNYEQQIAARKWAITEFLDPLISEFDTVIGEDKLRERGLL